jgi:hypothetical protein
LRKTDFGPTFEPLPKALKKNIFLMSTEVGWGGRRGFKVVGNSTKSSRGE